MLFATGWTGDSTIDFLVGGEAFRPSLVALSENCKSLRNVCKYSTVKYCSVQQPSNTSLFNAVAVKYRAVSIPQIDYLEDC